MKHKLANICLAVLLGWCTSLGGLCCLANAFQISVSRNALAVCCLAPAIAACVLLATPRGSKALFALLALCLGFLSHWPDMWQQSRGFISILLAKSDQASSVLLPMALLGGLLELPVCFCIMTGKRRFPAVLPALVTLLLSGAGCAQPPAFAVWALLFCMTLLILTTPSRKAGIRQGNALVLRTLLPLAAMTLSLALANPREHYRDHGALLREKLTSATFPALTSRLLAGASASAELSLLSGAATVEQTVLLVTAPQTGTLYLRGQSYDTYTGLGWRAEQGLEESFSGRGRQLGTLHIQTLTREPILYLPYYPGDTSALSGGRVKNACGWLRYDIPMYADGVPPAQQELSRYTSLPDDTLNWARELVTSDTTPEQIRHLTSTHLPYSLDTPRMPQQLHDFALWFWEEAPSGYCVHFATLATVLLRAAGIPARYVTGYLTQGVADTPREVTSRQAHAWAEYYDSDTDCWCILEATPGTSDPPQTTRELPAEQGKSAPSFPLALPGAAGVGLFLFLALLFLRRWVLLAVRHLHLGRSCAKARLLLYWQQAQRLSRRLKKSPPGSLEALAEKARYSNHSLAPGEAEQVLCYCLECRETLKKRPWWHRLADKYILVLY